MLLISVRGVAETIPLVIEAGSFTQYPVAVGVPFPKDEKCLDSISEVSLTKIDGNQAIPFQIHELCQWENNKIKSALVQFLASPGDYKIEYGAGITNKALAQNTINVREELEYIEVDTGVLKFRVNKKYGKLFDGIWLNNEQAATSGDMEIIGIDGTSYKASNYQYTANEVKIEESGPVRACIRIGGKYVASNNIANNFRYIVRIYAYAGKGYLQLSHTIIDESSVTKEEVKIKGYNIRLNHKVSNPIYKFGKENEGYYENTTDGEYYLWQTKANEYTGNIGNGTQASGWMDVNNGSMGIISEVRYFWQNYPAGLVANKDTLTIWLHPENATEEFSGGAGIAKTHKLMLYFYKGAFNQDVTNLASLFRHNIFPKISSTWYCDSGVFGKILPNVVGDPTPDIQTYGYKYFGKSSEVCHRATSDDPGNQDLLYYIQNSNNRDFFDKGEIRFWHSADMHIIHAEYGQPDVWGQISTQGGCRGYQTGCGGVCGADDRCHSQVAGSGVYYLLTGDKWAEEVIRKCGECRYKNWVDLPDRMTNSLVEVGQERERGVELWRAMQAYNATGDEKYLKGMTESIKGLIGNYKRGFWMQHQSSTGPEFLGKGYYWDNFGNYCKHAKDQQNCRIAIPWMSAYMFVPLVEYDGLNKYYNFVESVFVENMLIECMEHIVKYLTTEKGGKIGLRQDGCLDWEMNYTNCRLAYPLIYIRKLSGNQDWDRLISSLLDKTWNERNWYYSQAERMFKEYQDIGIKSVTLNTSKRQAVFISWETSEGVNKLVYGQKRFDGNVKDGIEVNVSGNSCELDNLISGQKYYFQFIANSGKKTWMYTFKTIGGIDNVAIAKITDTSATIKWTTDFDGNSAIEYSTEEEWIASPGIYKHVEKITEQVKNHEVCLVALKKATGYHFRIRSQGQGYNSASIDDTFPTEGGVSSVNAYPVDGNSAVLTFLTWPGPYYLFDAYSKPLYNITISYGKSSSSLSNSIKTEYGAWGIVLRGLDSDTTYYYQINVDFRNFPAVISPIYSFVTNKKYEEPIPQRILCDFGRKDREEPDNRIDFEDLLWFTLYWNAFQKNSQDLRGDIANSSIQPAGQPSDWTAQHDGQVNFDDLIIFTYMWNWYNN